MNSSAALAMMTSSMFSTLPCAVAKPHHYENSMKKHTPFKFFAVLSVTLILSLSTVVAAQDTPPPQSPDLLPVKSAEEAHIALDETNPTHPAIKLTPDKSELIRLERKAASVILGNPAHLSILPEGPSTLVLVPKAPGATYFMVLDEENKIIMQRHVIVAGPQEKYVRIRKSCASSRDCQPTQVYYCPDMCHEILLNGTQDGKNTGAVSGAPAATGNSFDETGKDEIDSGKTAPQTAVSPSSEQPAATNESGGDEETTTE